MQDIDTLIRPILDADGTIAYALVFGSTARGRQHPGSDVDIAIGLGQDQRLSTRALGLIVSRLEQALGRRVDLVIVNEAPSPIAYRIFKDGRLLFERDHAVLTRHKERAVLDYLDFKPIEDICAQGVLRAAGDGR